MKFDIANQPEMRVAAVRHIGAYSDISEAFTRLSKLAVDADLFGPGVVMLGLYHDDPQSVPENKLRSDAAITLRDGAEAPGGTTEIKVAAGRYVRATYTGPYTGLPGAWSELMTWFEGKDEQWGEGVSYELYRNDPTDTAPDDLITEIYAPLA